jgi:hypothetical protein
VLGSALLVGTLAMKIMASFEGTDIGGIVLYVFFWVYSLGRCTDPLYAVLFFRGYTWK